MNHPEIIIVPGMFALIGYVSWLLVTSGMRIMRELDARLKAAAH